MSHPEFLRSNLRRLLPNLYSSLASVKHLIEESVVRYPKLIDKSLDGITFKMLVRTRREKSEVNGRFFEKGVILSVLETLREGDVFMDIGSSTGTYTLPAAIKCGERGSVIAVDPDTETVEALDYNIKLNKLQNVTILPFAIAQCDGESVLLGNGLIGPAPRIMQDEDQNQNSRSTEAKTKVKTRSIESLVIGNEIRNPDVLKIDVEGFGESVLSGLGKIRPKHIFMEVHPQLGEDLEKIYALLCSKGYVIKTCPTLRDNQAHIHFVLN